MEVWFDEPRNLMVYPLTAGAPLHVLPEAVRIDGKYFAVPRTLQNGQILRFYQYPVVPLITDKSYDWPIRPGWKPLEHQRVTANFQALHPRCFNLSDPGTMKTQSTLWAADWLMRQWPAGQFRALIIAPLSILESVWGDALFKTFLSHRKFEILHGSEKARIKALAKPADFYICNPDGISVGARIDKKGVKLGGFAAALAARQDIKLCVVDEASCYKDGTTNRHRIARQIIRRPYLWMLTGTPTPNAPTDAHGLAVMVNNAFGKSFSGFRQETMMKVSLYKWVPYRDGYDRARSLLTPSIRYDIKDVWDGPEMTTQVRVPALTDAQKRYMAELKRELTITMAGGAEIDAVNEAALRTKFLQISAGAIYDANHKVHYIDAAPRFRELEAVIEQANGKVVIFSSLTSVVDMLSQKLTKWSRAVVNGSTRQKDRTAIFSAFQNDPDPHLLICDPGTMGHGIDLFSGRVACWYGPTDKTELYIQANKRLHRPGQKYPVTVTQIVSNKLEHEIYKRLETNTSLQGALLDMIRKGEL